MLTPRSGFVPGLLAFALLLAAGGPAVAETYAVLGGKIVVRDPAGIESPERRRVSVVAHDKRNEDPFNGDPTLDGATLTVTTRGDGVEYSETYVLPAAGWTERLKMHDWPVFKTFAYSNAATGGPVERVLVRRAGFGSPEGTPPPPQPIPGFLRVKVQITGRDGAIGVLPPNPGTEAGFSLTLGTGDTYCSGFGGAAGGSFASRNDETSLTIRRPDTKACLAAAP
jgi:hypothetical protein